jgi:predicted transcriptional regulator
MIIRILGDHRYEVDDSEEARIVELDDALTASLDAGDEAPFTSALDGIISWVQSVGKVLEHDDLRTSDLVVPNQGSTVEEVRQLLESDESSS